MEWKRTGLIIGMTAGVFLGMKYVFPVMLPFLCGWILAEVVYPAADILSKKKYAGKCICQETESVGGLSLA